jgi:outer membrane protein assembly factor BamA
MQQYGMLRSCALACLFLLWLADAGEAQAGGPDSVRIARVGIQGAQAFDPAILRTGIETSGTRCTTVLPLCWIGLGKQPQYLDSRVVELDALRLDLFYYRSGYRNAEVRHEIVLDGDEARVTFHITENQPVRVASIGVDGLGDGPAGVARGLRLRVGAPFDLTLAEAVRDTLIVRLYNSGYPWAEVLLNSTIPPDSPHVAHVLYETIPGPFARFDEIRIENTEGVPPAVVRRMLTFDEGDIYSQNELRRSQRNLFAQEIFSHAEVHTDPGQPRDSTVSVTVGVIEGDIHRIGAGAGLSTADYLTLEGQWISRNFQGGARRLQVRARVSNLLSERLGRAPLFEDVGGIYSRLSGLLSVDLTQPWFFDALNTLNASVFVERRGLPQVYVRTAVGGALTFSRTIGVSASMSLAYRPELTKLETDEGDLLFCLGFFACGEEDIRALSQSHWLAPLTFSIGWDRSNNIFSPSRGFVMRSEAELATQVTGSDFSYFRLAGEIIDYSTLTSGYILASRLRPGVAWPMERGGLELGVHPTRRFFGGGPNSVRGYAQYRMGPKLLTADPVRQLALPADSGGAGCTAQRINAGECDASPLADADPGAFRVQPVGGAAVFEGNVELRFPLIGDVLRGVAFTDFGQVWPDHRSVDLREIVLTPGIGVRYFSPIGPIRVDIGYNPAGAERVTVVTSAVEFCPPDAEACEPIEPGVMYDHRFLRSTGALRAQPEVAWNPRSSFWRRLQLHFSIGQAF